MTDTSIIIVLIIALVVLVLSVITIIITISNKKQDKREKEEMIRRQNEIREELRDDLSQSERNTRAHIDSVFKNYGDAVSANIGEKLTGMSDKIRDFQDVIGESSRQNEQKLDNIRTSMREQLTTLTRENNDQLEKMRETVDEKLQKTLEDRIGSRLRE